MNVIVLPEVLEYLDDLVIILYAKNYFGFLETAISSWGGTRKLPYAFTEHGVAMLASVLKSKKAIEINLDIVRAFITLRQYALGYAELNRKIEDYMCETNSQFEDIYHILDELSAHKKELEKPQNRIGFVVR